MQLDIYDFDKTIVPFDSGSRFLLFCLVRYPWTVLLVPYELVCAVLCLLGILSFTRAKQAFFFFVAFIPHKKAAAKFWDKHEKQVFEWAKKENRERYTVVISASPDFLLNEIARRLEFDALICTRHSLKTGAVIGKNCRGEEKVRRFREEFPDAQVVSVYSDSLKADKPIFSLGKRCFHIVKGERIGFDFEEAYNEQNVKS